MICERLPLINMRIRVARASAHAGQCAIAIRWLKRAGRDLRAVGPRAAMSPCERVLAKSTAEMLIGARRELHVRCGRP
jgi:hypothetical protein